MPADVEAKKREELPVIFGAVTDKNIEQLRRLNSKIFPVKYDDKFYSDVRESGEFTKLGALLLRRTVLLACFQKRTAFAAYYSTDILIGAICCRLERQHGSVKLYVMTVGVLQPYRHLGVGTTDLAATQTE